MFLTCCSYFFFCSVHIAAVTIQMTNKGNLSGLIFFHLVLYTKQSYRASPERTADCVSTRDYLKVNPETAGELHKYE